VNTPARLAAFATGIAVVFAAAFGVGHLAGPAPTPAPATGHAGGHAGADHPTAEAGGHAEHDPATPAAVPAGLSVTDRGYTLDPDPLEADRFAFRILGPDGHPVTRFDTVHDKAMHLIVVRRDLSGFQHVHPQLGPDGTWRVPLRLAGAGVWRAYADFTATGGPALTLGADLHVPGDYAPAALPAPAAVAQVEDYRVELAGSLAPGAGSPVRLRVTRGGVPVTDLQPYLGAAGHLVALRQADLAYLHVHPDGPVTGGPEVPFVVEVPAAGTYRLFLDFQHRGVVRTAAFTVVVEGGAHAHN